MGLVRKVEGGSLVNSIIGCLPVGLVRRRERLRRGGSLVNTILGCLPVVDEFFLSFCPSGRGEG